MRRSVIALWGLSVLGAAPLGAQRQTEQNAFTWAGRIPSGHWIRVRNLNGEINVTSSNSDRVEVTATKQWRRSDPESVRFEVRKYGANEEDVVICAIWNDRTDCDDRGYDSHNVRKQRRQRSVSRHGAAWREGRYLERERRREHRWRHVGGRGLDGEWRGRGDVVWRSVTASTVNGSVRARMGRFDNDEDLNFSTVNGSVVAEFTAILTRTSSSAR